MYVYMLAIFLLSPFLSPILSFFSFITFSCTVFFHLLFPFFSLLLLYRFSSFHVLFSCYLFSFLLSPFSLFLVFSIPFSPPSSTLYPFLSFFPFLPPPSTVVAKQCSTVNREIQYGNLRICS